MLLKREKLACRLYGVAGITGILAAILSCVFIAANDVSALARIERFVRVTVSSSDVDMGNVSFPGLHDLAPPIATHLIANCNHGRLLLTATAFQAADGSTIGPDRLFVKLPGTEQYVTADAPVALKQASGPRVFDFDLEFRVLIESTDPAGVYTGTLQLVVEAVEDGSPEVMGPTITCQFSLDAYAQYQLIGTRSYIHIGNVFDASSQDMTLNPTAVFSANAAMFVGLNLSSIPGLTAGSIVQDGSGRPTGRVQGAMVGSIDGRGEDISSESMDIEILMSCDAVSLSTSEPPSHESPGCFAGEGHAAPSYYGDSPDGQTDKTLWWLLNGGVPGVYDLDWQIQLLPEPGQADGNYYFEAEVVVTPKL